MQRPQSIVTFERCYLGALVIGAVNAAISWSYYQSLVTVQQSQAMIGTWYMPTITAIGFIIPLILWYFAARRASVVAKWIIVIFFALGCIALLLGLATASYGVNLRSLLSIAALVLNAVSVWHLFRPDAKAWFGEQASSEGIEQA